jgi:hypothetical protein
VKLTANAGHATGDTFVSEPSQIPAGALSDTLDGTALDLDADAVAGLLSGRAAAISYDLHDQLP